LTTPRRNHALRPGLILIGDKGFAGREFEQLVTASFRLSPARPDRRDAVPRHGSIGWIRRWTESIFDTVKWQLSLEAHGARTDLGVYTAPPSACRPWPPPSGITGPSTRRSSAP